MPAVQVVPPSKLTSVVGRKLVPTTLTVTDPVLGTTMTGRADATETPAMDVIMGVTAATAGNTECNDVC